MTKRVDLRKKYEREIRGWDWWAIVKECQTEMEEDPDDEYQMIGRCFLGTVFAIMPSGKYYMPWTTNQTYFDMVKDATFYEILEKVAEEHGLFIESGEGDPCDMMACMVKEKVDEKMV